MSKTLFIDLDGTLVHHNYWPSEIKDQLLPGVLLFLTNARSAGHYCILTTNRSENNSRYVIELLRKKIQFEFDRMIFDLPVGIRVLINDSKGDEIRAVAIPIIRNKGLVDLDI